MLIVLVVVIVENLLIIPISRDTNNEEAEKIDYRVGFSEMTYTQKQRVDTLLLTLARNLVHRTPDLKLQYIKDILELGGRQNEYCGAIIVEAYWLHQLATRGTIVTVSSSTVA